MDFARTAALAFVRANHDAVPRGLAGWHQNLDAWPIVLLQLRTREPSKKPRRYRHLACVSDGRAGLRLRPATRPAPIPHLGQKLTTEGSGRRDARSPGLRPPPVGYRASGPGRTTISSFSLLRLVLLVGGASREPFGAPNASANLNSPGEGR